jgi:hypothetical protein
MMKDKWPRAKALRRLKTFRGDVTHKWAFRIDTEFFACEAVTPVPNPISPEFCHPPPRTRKIIASIAGSSIT